MLNFGGKPEAKSQGKVSEHRNLFVLRCLLMLNTQSWVPRSHVAKETVKVQSPPKKRKLRGDITYIIGTQKGYCDIVIYNKNIYCVFVPISSKEIDL